jgi:hypothetical protein
MNKMKQMIEHIEKLEVRDAKLLKLLTLENIESIDICVNTRNTNASARFITNLDEIKPFIQNSLDILRAELNPLKERMKLLTELLDGVK